MEVIRGESFWSLKGEGLRAGWRLPVSASMESLCMNDWAGSLMRGAIVRYDGRVLVAADRLDGVMAAVYEFVDDDCDVDSRLNLIWVHGELHRDAGHALEACMNWCRFN